MLSSNRFITIFKPSARLTMAFAFMLGCWLSHPLAAQTFLFDFGGNANITTQGESPNDPDNVWNNVIESVGLADTGQLSNIVTTAGFSSTLTLDMIHRFNGVNNNGTQESTVYAARATMDSMYGNTEVFNSLEDVFPEFKLSGFESGSLVTLTFYGSRGGVGDNRETEFTVTGGDTALTRLNMANNINQTTQLEDVVPDANGEITIAIGPGPSNDNGNHFTYLGVLQVDVIPPQGPLTFVREPSNIQATEQQTVTFSAEVEGPMPYFAQWFSNSIPIVGANALEYSIPMVTLDMDRSMFSLTVSNYEYSVTSSNAVLRVVTDTEPPTLVSATSPDGNVIYLEFSEAMDSNTTDDNFLYGILEPAGVAVISALLQPDGRTVALGVSPQISGMFTVLVAGGTSDLSANPIEPGSTISGEVPDIDLQGLLIDFGASGNTTENGPAPDDDPVNYWNNVTDTIGSVPGSEVTNLVTTLNAATTIGLVIVDRFNGANGSGTQADAPYARDATRDSLYGNTEVWGGLTDIFPVFTLAGLKTDLVYDLTFYASRTGVGDNRETIYTITGAEVVTASLNPANNVTEQVLVEGVEPDGNGEIRIGLTPGANNNNGNHFTYLGVLRIDPKRPTARFLVPLVADGQILLQWTGGGQLQWAPEVTGPWTDVIPTPVDLHAEAIENGGRRFYRLVPLP